MNSKLKRITSATALLLAFAVAQTYVSVSLAESAGNGNTSAPPPQQVGAVLTTGNNQPITVNGASTISGATIMTGATIETPDQIGASLSIPGHFTLDITPKASLSVEFDQNGIKVNLVKGCVVLHTKKSTNGEIDTANGAANKADGSRDTRLEICDPTIATAPAAAAGATEMGLGGKIAIIGAFVGLVSIPLLGGGANPSPGGP